MRQRHDVGRVAPPTSDGLGQVFLRRGEVPFLSVKTNKQRQPNIWQKRQYGFSPGVGAFLSRRKIPAFSSTRKAKAHWQYRDLLRIVESFTGNPQPITESVAAWVVKRDPGLVDATPGSLTGDENSSVGADLQHRARSKRQGFLANPAGRD